MSSTQRVVLTVVICVGLMVAYQALFMPKQQPAPPQANQRGQATAASQPAATPSSTAQASASQPAASQPAAHQPSASGPATTISSDPNAGPISADLEGKQTSVQAVGGVATFSDVGGTLRHFVLKHPRYKEHRKGKLVDVDLVRTPKNKGPWQLLTTFPESAFSVPTNARFTLEQQTKNELRYSWQSQLVKIEKRYTIDAAEPQIRLTVTVHNKTDRPLPHRLRLSVFNEQEAGQKAGVANPYPRLPTGLCFVNAELQRRSIGAITGSQSGCSPAGCGMGDGPVTQVGDVSWVASDDRYFLTAVVPQGKDTDRRCDIQKLDNRDIVEASVRFAEQTIGPRSKIERKFVVFVGAKDVTRLDMVQTSGGDDAGLTNSIEFGWFAVLCRPMLALLKGFHTFTGNWGIAIILLTLIVKAITLYPTHRSMVSMKRMQVLKPKMDELRQRYGNDKQRLNQEMMGLYKTYKINPFGGCLPMLLQMPIWFALYRTLGNAVELYRSPFFGWIHDLTAPDHYFVLPILMGASMFAQQLITPQPIEGTQAKMMKYFMPGMFTVMMLWLPAGLTLYIFINTLLSMFHQFYLNRKDPTRDMAAALKKVIPPAGDPRPSNNGGPRRKKARTQEDEVPQQQQRQSKSRRKRRRN